MGHINEADLRKVEVELNKVFGFTVPKQAPAKSRGTIVLKGKK